VGTLKKKNSGLKKRESVVVKKTKPGKRGPEITAGEKKGCPTLERMEADTGQRPEPKGRDGTGRGQKPTRTKREKKKKKNPGQEGEGGVIEP